MVQEPDILVASIPDPRAKVVTANPSVLQMHILVFESVLFLYFMYFN